MSVSLICPYCGTAATLHRAPVSACPQCQTAWPEPLRLSAEAALARERVSRPVLLTIGMYVAPAYGGFLLLLLLLAPFNAATYRISGETVTGMEFLRSGGLILGIGSIASLAAAYAIRQERSWSRWAILFFWAAQIAGGIAFGLEDSGVSGAARTVASMLLPVVLSWWYLFEKDNVVEYFLALEKSEAAEAQRRPPQ